MYFWVNVDHNGMVHISTEVNVNGFKKLCTSNAMDKTDYNVL
jgi:hypothetical protein